MWTTHQRNNQQACRSTLPFGIQLQIGHERLDELHQLKDYTTTQDIDISVSPATQNKAAPEVINCRRLSADLYEDARSAGVAT